MINTRNTAIRKIEGALYVVRKQHPGTFAIKNPLQLPEHYKEHKRLLSQLSRPGGGSFTLGTGPALTQLNCYAYYYYVCCSWSRCCS
jgi:hypothetical protein